MKQVPPEQDALRKAQKTAGVLQGITGLTKSDSAGQDGLNKVIRRMLIAGLILSTIAMGAGILFGLVQKAPVPYRTADFGQVLEGVRCFSPGSYLSLGLLLLIATPILRVLGSLVEFAVRGDWRYVCITLLVLLVLSVSMLLSG